MSGRRGGFARLRCGAHGVRNASEDQEDSRSLAHTAQGRRFVRTESTAAEVDRPVHHRQGILRALLREAVACEVVGKARKVNVIARMVLFDLLDGAAKKPFGVGVASLTVAETGEVVSGYRDGPRVAGAFGFVQCTREERLGTGEVAGIEGRNPVPR
jgi:hypothetical protein